MGKFDERLPGEKPGERVISSKRQKFDPVSGKSGTELKKVCDAIHCSWKVQVAGHVKPAPYVGCTVVGH